MDSKHQSVKQKSKKSKKAKKAHSDRVAAARDDLLESKRKHLHEIESEAALGAILLQLFSQLETDAMNRLFKDNGTLSSKKWQKWNPGFVWPKQVRCRQGI